MKIRAESETTISKRRFSGLRETARGSSPASASMATEGATGASTNFTPSNMINHP